MFGINPHFVSFACFAYNGRGIDLAGDELQVADDLYVAPQVPVKMDDFWEAELGRIASGRLADANTVFLKFATNDNYEAAKSFLTSFHYGLLLQGTGYPVGPTGTIIGGPVGNEMLHVSSIGDMWSYSEPPKVISSAVNMEHCVTAVTLANGIDSIYSHHDATFLRLRKGFGAYILGLRSHEIYIRLHQFVRAIEAAVKPRRNNLKNDFKSRSLAFTLPNANSEQILDDLYELRSAAEHLSPMQDKLARFAPDQRLNTMAQRCYQAEILARNVYRKILASPVFSQRYESDVTIDAFWNSPDAQVVHPFGGERPDLALAAQENYHDFLAPN